MAYYNGKKVLSVVVGAPSGNLNITDTQIKDVSQYATAQVVDANLIPANIKKDVSILGVVGTHEGGGGNQPTLFTPYLSIDYVTSILTISDGNGDFANYDLYYDNNGVWTLVASGLGKNINLSTYFPTHNSDISLKVQAKGTDFISSDYSSVIVWQYGLGTPGLAYTLNSDNQSYSCSGIGTATETDIEVGSVHLNTDTNEFLPVTGISSNSFRNNTSITSVFIPDTVTILGNGAFNTCTNLRSAIIGNHVITIERYVFNNCSALTSLFIPKSVNSIGPDTFTGCNNLESITVENGNMAYSDDGNCLIEIASNTLLQGCKNSVIPSDGSVTIISTAFYKCSGLTSIVIPSSVTHIGQSAFFWCSGLTSIVIPSSVTNISSYAFYLCNNLTSITINSVTPPTISNATFDSTNNCPIYVPAESVTAYQNDTNFATYASRIQALPS